MTAPIDTTTHFCSICGGDVETAADLLAGLAAAPALIAEAIEAASSAARDGWSPAEIAAHLADTEIVAAWRFRQALAEHEPEIGAFDQDRWASSGRYPERDLATSLQTFAAVRAANVELLRLLDDAGWLRTYRHAEYGRTTVRALAQHKSDHDLGHLRQIEQA
jgi:nuclear transport factor 2 (NTF2) superfamily protein